MASGTWSTAPTFTSRRPECSRWRKLSRVHREERLPGGHHEAQHPEAQRRGRLVRRRRGRLVLRTHGRARRRAGGERQAVKERLLKYAKYAPLVGYPLFYLLCLAVFAALTFPYDKLKQRVVATFNAEQRTNSGQQELQIDEMGGYWLRGVRVRGARLLTASPAEPNKPPTKLENRRGHGALLDPLGAHRQQQRELRRVRLRRRGQRHVRRARQGQGHRPHPRRRRPVRHRPHLPDPRRPGAGQARGHGADVAARGQADQGFGRRGARGHGRRRRATARPRSRAPWPCPRSTWAPSRWRPTRRTACSRSEAGRRRQGRRAVRAKGASRCARASGDSLCDAQARFKINDAYRSKSDITKSLFGAPGSNAPALFELADPKHQAVQAGRRLLRLDAARASVPPRLHPGRRARGRLADGRWRLRQSCRSPRRWGREAARGRGFTCRRCRAVLARPRPCPRLPPPPLATPARSPPRASIASSSRTSATLPSSPVAYRR